MRVSIDRILYLDYSKEIGYKYSLLNFTALQMEYLGIAFSTSQVSVQASPTEFRLSETDSERIREFFIENLVKFEEISKVLADNSPRYVVIYYSDETVKYFRFNETINSLFSMVLQCKPEEKTEPYISPYALQPDYAIDAMRVIKKPEPVFTTPSVSATPAYSIPETEIKSTPWGKITGWTLSIFAVLMVIAVLVIPKQEIAPPPTPIPTATPTPKLTPVPQPFSGSVLIGSPHNTGGSITVQANANYSTLVKLKDVFGNTKLSFYVRAGETVTVNAQKLTLYVYFASGKTWYGTDYLFGDTTFYGKDAESVDFSEYDITYNLNQITNGNFETTEIDPNEF